MTLDIVIFGLSITSSWGNGHATTYRALLREFSARGHDVLFLERDQPWYAEHRDMPDTLGRKGQENGIPVGPFADPPDELNLRACIRCDASDRGGEARCRDSFMRLTAFGASNNDDHSETLAARREDQDPGIPTINWEIRSRCARSTRSRACGIESKSPRTDVSRALLVDLGPTAIEDRPYPKLARLACP